MQPEPGPRGRSFFLLVMPLLFFLTALVVKNATGPYFLSCNADPDYAYLLNSLSVSLGQTPAHIDHPGTPLQMAGGALLKCLHLGHDRRQAATETIRSAESYLTGFNLLVSSLASVAIFLCGFFLYQTTKRMGPAVLGQSAFLFLGPNIYCLGRVNPEPILFLLAFLLGTLLVKASFDSTFAKGPFFLWASAIIGSAGIATKITFLPVALLPFYFAGNNRQRLLLGGLLFLFVTLWLAPILHLLPAFLNWINRLFWHAERYGTGTRTILDGSSYLSNVRFIVSQNAAFLALTGASVAGGIFFLRSALPETRRTARGLLVISLAQVLQMALICKYRENRHLTPAVGLAGASVVLLNMLWQNHRWHRWFASGFLLLFIAAASTLIAGGWHLASTVKERQAVHERMGILSQGETKVFVFGASSPEYALHFGNTFAGRSYGDILDQLYPENVFFYNAASGTFRTFNRILPGLPSSASGRVWIQMGTEFTSTFPPTWHVQEILRTAHEAILQASPAATDAIPRSAARRTGSD